jgi:alkyl sulfatase BDS1-like metallo-beta-lactamase superfamily hydrolase
MSGRRKPASERTAARNREALGALPFDDEGDFAEASRGLVAPFEPPLVEDEQGRTVWDLGSYDFLDGEPPATVHPSLWRQGRLCRIAGLFELTPGLYQLRGFDISNMHVIEGEQGIVVVDPLISAECAAAALALYREHRGDRPVTGLLYTHSHVDHFGGARGVISPREAAEREIPILAPAGFLHHAVSENVYAGMAMGRRAGYMFGALLERGPEGQLGAGLGQTNSVGTVSLIPPTLEVAATGQEEVVDGVRFAFHLTPGTEAPAEMNFHLPELRALCIADNAARAMHNVLTLRGALVRDSRVWANYLDEAIELFGDRADVLFGGHHWPCWGSERIAELLEKQRDLYAYLHDQTLRLLNRGHTGPEISELVELPPSLAREWHCREYYGSISHNVKAIYQRYMGWFDGNPAHLWEHPPVERARRYVESMGGAGAVLERGRAAFEAGDYRWVAELVNHLVFAEPGNREARELQADALEQLGYGAENAIWRNFFLAGAGELREGVSGTLTAKVPPDIVAGLSVGQLLDAMAIRLDGPRAWEHHLRIDWVVTEPDEAHAITVRNGVLRHRPGRHGPDADATLIVAREALNQLVLKTADLAELAQSGKLRVEGDGARIGALLGLLDEPDPAFPIVTPAGAETGAGGRGPAGV